MSFIPPSDLSLSPDALRLLAQRLGVPEEALPPIWRAMPNSHALWAMERRASAERRMEGQTHKHRCSKRAAD